MQAALDKAEEMNYKVFQWNILDVTERCPSSRHLPDEPKADRYVAKGLPLIQMGKEEFEHLPDVEKPKYNLVSNAFKGCASCKLLPVCKMRLAAKPEGASGGFYKPIVSVIQKFAENDPDTGEAQLMCWKPGSAGLVFPRFKNSKKEGNVLTLREAYKEYAGVDLGNISELTLLHALKQADIPIYCGVDWGFTHDAVIVVAAKMPNDEIWIIDCFSSPGLEFQDVLETAIKFRDKYSPQKWFCDQAMPSHIKSFNKNGMRSPKFTKDVVGGIESIRSKILTGSGKRLLKIVETDNTKKVIAAITKHRFLLDGQGNVTPKPDDEPGIADICDAFRYIGQNLFPIKGPQKPTINWTDRSGNPTKPVDPTHENQMRQEVTNRVSEGSGGVVIGGKKGGFSFRF